MKFQHKRAPVNAAIALALAGGALSAFAGETIEFGDGYKFDWRINANYTLGQRMKSIDPLLSANASGNDGDNNFAKHSLTANRLSALFEGKISKDRSGFLLSASTFYDDVYHRSNDNPGISVSKPGRVNEFSDQAKRYHGGYSRILDAYAYTAFDFGDNKSAAIRIGRQAVNWGEAVFFPNIAQAQGPFDGTKSGIPGTETKDVILPEDQITASIVLSPKLTVLGQVQFGFHETIAPAPGSFLSSSDATGPGASCIGVYNGGNTCLGFQRKDDITPSSTGQWGIGARYRVTDETEAGLYYLNYNDRTPLPIIQPKPPSFRTGDYQIRYFDDVKLLGGTVSTSFGSTTAYGEMTYRKGVPILVGALNTPKRANATQINIGSFTNLGRSALADSVQLLAEVVATKYSGYEGTKKNLGFKTDNGVAFSTTLVLGYPGIFEGWDLTVPLSYQQQLAGRTLVGGVGGGGKGDKRYSLGATFVRRGNMSVNVSYLGYLGDASLDTIRYRPLADRDQLSLNLKYSF